MKDANTIAYQVLKKALSHHMHREHARLIEYRRAWTAAKLELRAIPSNPRPRLQPLTAYQLSRIGTIEGL